MSSAMPSELLEHVMSFFHEDGQSLIHCTLVSRRWRALAQRLLFRRLSITLYSKPRGTKLWADMALPAVTHLLHFVRTLNLKINGMEPPDVWAAILFRLVPLCPHMRALECGFFGAQPSEMGPLLQCFQEALPAISSLSLKGMCFDNPTHCMMALAQSKNLTYLKIDGCSVEDGSWAYEQEPAKAWSARMDAALPVVRTTALEVVDFEERLMVMPLLPLLAGPQLHSLNVTFRHTVREMVKITTSRRAATLTKVVLNLESYYDDGWVHPRPEREPMHLSWWVPPTNQIVELTLVMPSMTDLVGLTLDVQLPCLRTLNIEVDVEENDVIKMPRDLLDDLGPVVASLRMVSLKLIMGPRATFNNNMWWMFASAWRRGILRIWTEARGY